MERRTWDDLGIEVPFGSRGNIKTLCPQCSAQRKHWREKCLSVDVEIGRWNCHNCGWAGYLSGDGATTRFVPVPPKREYRKPDAPVPTSDLTAAAQAFFTNRGIDLSLVRQHNITGDDRALKFPYYRNGELINIKTRYYSPTNPEMKNFSLEEGCELIFWGLDDCAGTDQVIIVEGEMDKLACEAAGLFAVLSVPNGANSKTLNYLASGEDVLARCSAIIIAVDNDEAGFGLETELARRIGKEKCRRVRWPEGYKDANEVLLDLGEAVLRRCVAEAKKFPIEGIVAPDDLRDDVLSYYRGSESRGMRTGWANIDELYTVRLGELTIVTGYPGSGKSEWLDALIVNLALREDWRFAVFSPENYPTARHLAKLAEKYVGKPFGEGPTPRMTEDELAGFIDWSDERLEFIAPENVTLDEILATAELIVFRIGANALIIDPWNEIEHSRPSNMTETEYISHCLTRIRHFARHFNLHVWTVAHPRKPDRDDNGIAKPPTPYDISGSANWFNKADNCLTVWRDMENDDAPVRVHVQKIRHKLVGRVGTARLHYDRVIGTYRDARGGSA